MPESVREALDACAAAYERLVETIDALPDAQAAYEAATEAERALRGFSEAAGRLRPVYVGKIWAAEELNLAGLAARLSVSKSRAHQFVDAAKATTKGGT